MKLPMFGNDWILRWLLIRGATLHRVYAIDWADDDMNDGDGVTACGRMDELHMPGYMSRFYAPRCCKCCAIAGVREGDGVPMNYGWDA